MNFGDFDLNLLKTLNALLTERHVTRAAESLGRSQPAVSNALQRLRTALGDELLVRSPKGLALTARAEKLQKPLRDLLALIENNVFGAAPFKPDSAEGLFRISMPDRLTIAVVPTLLERLQKLAPKISLHVITADRDQALQRLNGEEIDLFIGWIKDVPHYLNSEFLADEMPYCVMRRGHRLMKPRAQFTLDAVLSHPHLVVSASNNRTQIFDDLLEKRGLNRHARVTLTNFTAVPHLLKQSDMIGVFTKLAADAFSKSFGLAKRPLPEDVGKIATYMIWQARNDRDQRHAWMRQQVKETYSLLR